MPCASTRISKNDRSRNASNVNDGEVNIAVIIKKLAILCKDVSLVPCGSDLLHLL